MDDDSSNASSKQDDEEEREKKQPGAWESIVGRITSSLKPEGRYGEEDNHGIAPPSELLATRNRSAPAIFASSPSHQGDNNNDRTTNEHEENLVVTEEPLNDAASERKLEEREETEERDKPIFGIILDDSVDIEREMEESVEVEEISGNNNSDIYGTRVLLHRNKRRNDEDDYSISSEPTTEIRHPDDDMTGEGDNDRVEDMLTEHMMISASIYGERSLLHCNNKQDSMDSPPLAVSSLADEDNAQVNTDSSSSKISRLQLQQHQPTVHEQSENTSNRRQRVYYMVLLTTALLLVAVVAVVVGVSLSRSSSSTSGSNTTPTETPSPIFPNEPGQQLGQDLVGTASKDFFGRSISISSNGRVLAVGADQASFNKPGYVSLFEFNTNTRMWSPKGQDLVGEGNGDRFGGSLSLNGDGNILAVGANLNEGGASGSGGVRVYQYNTSNRMWAQLGNEINARPFQDEFGMSLSLSVAGDVLVVGAPGSDTTSEVNVGSVDVFQYNSDTATWENRGQTLVGTSAFDGFGYSVAINSSGSIVGIGAIRCDVGGDNAGQVTVFQYSSIISTWVPMGEQVNGMVENGSFGSSVSLDHSGLVLAVGAPGSSGSDMPARVLVFEFDNPTSVWMQRGQTLLSDGPDDDFGASVSLSGNVLAVGIPDRNVTGLEESGQVRIFQYNASTTEWNKLGDFFNGTAAGDLFGSSVSICENGTVVGIGAHLGDANGLEDSGYARAFSLR